MRAIGLSSNSSPNKLTGTRSMPTTSKLPSSPLSMKTPMRYRKLSSEAANPTGMSLNWTEMMALSSPPGNSFSSSLEGRKRTVSADSGCDLNWDQPACQPDLTFTLVEDILQSWIVRVESVVKQEVERAVSITNTTKRSLLLADDESREIVLTEWKRQMEDIMDFTQDLVECVNNDAKDQMYEMVERSPGNESSSTLEEIDEEMEKEQEEEMMQLFMLSVAESKKSKKKGRKKGQILKEFITLYRKGEGSKFSSKKRAHNRNLTANANNCRELQAAYSKLKRHEVIRRRREKGPRFSASDIFQDAISHQLKMFLSVMDPEDILEDWNHNFLTDENDEEQVEDGENSWPFWREFGTVEDILANTLAAEISLQDSEDCKMLYHWEDPDIALSLLDDDVDSGCLADTEAEVGGQEDNDDVDLIYFNVVSDPDDDEDDEKPEDYWQFWEDNFVNEMIVKSLLDDEEIVNDWHYRHTSYWIENKENQDILEDLLREEVAISNKRKRKLFKDDDIVFEEDDDLCKALDESYEFDLNGNFFNCSFNRTNTAVKDNCLYWDPNEGNKEIVLGLVSLEDETPIKTTGYWDIAVAENRQIMDELLEDNQEEGRKVQPASLSSLCLKKIAKGPAKLLEKLNSKSQSGAPKSAEKKDENVNITSVFWEITLSPSPPPCAELELSDDFAIHMKTKANARSGKAREQRDPANIFRSWRFIFDEAPRKVIKPRKGKTHSDVRILEDMEDSYPHWEAPNLADGRSQRKWEKRGRKNRPSAPSAASKAPEATERRRAPPPAQSQRSGKQHRPRTPPISYVAVGRSGQPAAAAQLSEIDASACPWIETKVPKKERKTTQVWRNAKTRRRLDTRIFPKQPKPGM